MATAGEALEAAALLSLSKDQYFGRAPELPEIQTAARNFAHAVNTAKKPRKKRTPQPQREWYRLAVLPNPWKCFAHKGTLPCCR